MSLTVITGPMAAGKTSYLLSEIDKSRIASQSVGIYKPLADTRSVGIKTHSGLTSDAVILPELPRDFNGFGCVDVIAIEEAQFLDPLWVPIIDVASFDVDVIVTCLNLDRYGNPFGISPQLLALADDIILLKAVCVGCRTKDRATRTFAKVALDSQVAVGGTDKYESLCKSCWRFSIERNRVK